ncbi:uncharacterized protein EI90DRAFT_3042303 [Cantharellus anzutake]|uniref:uncharacterized protein n=1 Tax=Cantharellus anzutake TaxID=1750568 RepID=UPI0019045968|nr:uncharacterized protein EI90DRAFT_3042303 [Cantharellus anzutake]KAF8338261.1 hypothetical protein EI90DRAFT_3042303 [Cantharellus anzutake]
MKFDLSRSSYKWTGIKELEFTHSLVTQRYHRLWHPHSSSGCALSASISAKFAGAYDSPPIYFPFSFFLFLCFYVSRVPESMIPAARGGVGGLLQGVCLPPPRAQRSSWRRRLRGRCEGETAEKGRMSGMETKRKERGGGRRRSERPELLHGHKY